MAAFKPYSSKFEFQAALDIIETSAKFKRIKALADAGNVQAAWYYGNILLTGGWDEYSLDVDFLRGKLLPETTNPNQDPYLLVPRDQYAAVHYHKIAASYVDEELALEASFSRAILGYFSRKVNIGYYGKGKLDNLIIDKMVAYIKSAKSEDIIANPLIPYPYKRPEVKDPKTKIFNQLANEIFSRNLAIFLISLLLNLFASGKIFASIFEDAWTKVAIFSLLSFFCTTFPLIIGCIVCKVYGVKRSFPICSCSTLREIYENNLRRLPEDCRVGADPFEKTPKLIRNFHHIMQAVIIIILSVSMIFFALAIMKTGPNLPSEFYLGLVFVSTFSVLVLSYDKKRNLVDKDCHNLSKVILFNGYGFPQI